MKRVLKWFLALFRSPCLDRVGVAPLPTTPIRKKTSRAARKRKAFKHCVRATIDAPILRQARDLGRQ